jgi:hypothetical protein
MSWPALRGRSAAASGDANGIPTGPPARRQESRTYIHLANTAILGVKLGKSLCRGLHGERLLSDNGGFCSCGC